MVDSARSRVLLLDFFGTLVDYSASLVDQGYERTHAELVALGSTAPYDAFLSDWEAMGIAFDAESQRQGRDHAMAELGDAFLTEHLGRSVDPGERDRFLAAYIDEWSTGVQPIGGVAELLTQLQRSHRIGVVTNTHGTTLVPGLLDAYGWFALVDDVVMSVEVGWRKPRPEIYRLALERFQADPADAVFVGDTLDADYEGPSALGIRALLIDPAERHTIDPADRLTSILDLPERL